MASLRIVISRDPADRRIAEAVADRLRSHGHVVDASAQRLGRSRQAISDLVRGGYHLVAFVSEPYLSGPIPASELHPWLPHPERVILIRVGVAELPHQLRKLRQVGVPRGPDETGALAIALARELQPRRAKRSEVWAAGSAVEERNAGSQRWHLPGRNLDFVGRGRLLEIIGRNLRRGGPVALHGRPGVGKSQLAAEYAHQFADDYELIAWIESEQEETVPERLAGLATFAGVARPERSIAESVEAIYRHARVISSRRWLLIFDNVESSAAIRHLLNRLRCHVIITSRSPEWERVATAVEVPLFETSESVKLLHRRMRGLSEAELAPVAERVGNLPLFVAQAAGFMAGTGTPPREYRRMLDTHSSHAQPKHSKPVAATVDISMTRLSRLDRAAAELVRACALLAPEHVPLQLFLDADPDTLSPSLATALVNEKQFSATTAALSHVGLARLDEGMVLLHRSTRQGITDSMTAAQRATARTNAEAVLTAARPDDGKKPETWSVWNQLLPHLVALSPDAGSSPSMQVMTLAAVDYLLARREAAVAKSLAERLVGDDPADRLHDPVVLGAAQRLASCHYELGAFESARQLDDRILHWCHSQLGERHQETLESASSLALDLHALGRFAESYKLNSDTLRAQTELLGAEHSHSLTTAHNLALDLHATGDFDKALLRNELTLEARRRVLGPEHLDTLMTAYNRASDLESLGRLDLARKAYAEIRAVHRRKLYEDHPDRVAVEEALGRVERKLDERQARNRAARPQQSMTRSRRVVALATEWSSGKGGINTLNRLLCQALADAGHHVVCVVPTATETEIAQALEHNVELVPAAPISNASVDLLLSNADNLPKSLMPDLVIGHGRITGPSACVLARRTRGARYVHFVHMSPDHLEFDKDDREDDPAERAEQRRRTEVDLAESADAVVAIGPLLFDTVERSVKARVTRRGAAGPRILRLDPGFDTPVGWIPRVPPGDTQQILLIGRLEDAKLKGLDLAAHAIGALVRERGDRGPRIEFVVRGALPGQAAALRETIREWAGVRSLEVIPRLFSADSTFVEEDLLSSSLVLMPSLNEGFGLVGLEAIIAEVPVLISNKSGLGELIREPWLTGVSKPVLPVTNDLQVDAGVWKTAIAAELHDREAAFGRAAKLRRAMAAQLTWRGAVDTLLEDLGADTEGRPRGEPPTAHQPGADSERD